jgi:predicted DNA-binding transcriptional regulator AlpA
MKPDRLNILPVSCPLRGLSRFQAATYIGVSVTMFDQMVSDGTMPGPKHINSRKIWDRLALDAAFESLPGDNGTQDVVTTPDAALEAMRIAHSPERRKKPYSNGAAQELGTEKAGRPYTPTTLAQR